MSVKTTYPCSKILDKGLTYVLQTDYFLKNIMKWKQTNKTNQDSGNQTVVLFLPYPAGQHLIMKDRLSSYLVIHAVLISSLCYKLIQNPLQGKKALWNRDTTYTLAYQSILGVQWKKQLLNP